MPKLIAESVPHGEFTKHVEEHNTTSWTITRKIFHMKEPDTHPKGDGHHYHKHKDHTPAAQNASFWVLPDLLFAIGFVAAVASQLYFCFSYGYSASDGDDDESTSNFTGLVAVAVTFAILFTQLFIQALVKMGTGVIAFVTFTACAILVGMGAASLYFGVAQDVVVLEYASVPFFVLGVGFAIYFWCNLGHIHFAGACLEIACQVVATHPMTEVVALGMTLAMACWSMVFSTALVGLQVYMEENGVDIASAIDDDTVSSVVATTQDDGNYSIEHYVMVWVAIVLTFYWGQQVMKGIVVCTTAGTTAEWWFNRTEVGHPTWQALKRSCTTSLGAIAFGSFFVAVIQTVCYVMNKLKAYIAKMPGGGQAACFIKIATCCLTCLQKCVEIFNFYCYVVVGIYGYGFLHAGCHVVGIFASKGLLLLEEGTLVEMVLHLGAGTVALCTGAVGCFVAYAQPSLVQGVPLAMFTTFTTCAIVGHGVAGIMFGVIEAANATVFISYVENPHALHNDHPAEYKKLHKAWLEMGREEVKHDYAEQWEATAEELAQEAEAEGLPPPEGEDQESSGGGDGKGNAPTANPVLAEGGSTAATL